MRRRPNIVFILIDDMGWRDLGCCGSTFHDTPNLDRFAAEGMSFSNAYAACPVCSPTRASILTGRYPARVGVTDYIDWVGTHHPVRGRLIDAPYLKGLPAVETSLAAALKKGGYATWHVGKWHLGQADLYPERHGFDVNVAGCEWGMPRFGYFSPWRIPTMSDGPAGAYLTDRLTDEAIALVRSAGKDRPFFLNLCHYAVHAPIQAKPEDVRRFEEKARRTKIDGIAPFVEGEPFPTTVKRHLRVTRRMIQSDPAYAAMVWNLDWNIGRLLAAIRECGLEEETVVVFTSDNGGLSTAEGAPTCNAPLAEGKGWMYEGGTREPLIVRFPGRIPAGSLCPSPVTSPDFYPTLLDIAGLDPMPTQHCDGVSFLPALSGRPGFDRGPIFWHYPHYGNQGGTPGCSVRMGDWKLIEFFEDGRLELYDLRTDVGETRNLAAVETTVAADLRRRLAGWRESVNALVPARNPEWTG